MTNYIREIKKQFRDKYHFKPSRMVGYEPLFDFIPDGEYPMEIDGKVDKVKVVNGKLSCCNFAVALAFLLLAGCSTGSFKNHNTEFSYSSLFRKTEFKGLTAGGVNGLKISSGSSIGDVESMDAFTSLIAKLLAETAAQAVRQGQMRSVEQPMAVPQPYPSYPTNQPGNFRGTFIIER